MEKLSQFNPEKITPETPIESHISHEDVISYLTDHLKLTGVESLAQAEIEIELEEEQRILVQPIDPSNYEGKWIDDIRDVYDKTDTLRVREKNHKLRLSIKIPLFSYDTSKTKCCLRIEIKPQNKEQEDCIFKTGENLIRSGESRLVHKLGTPIYLTNDKKVWLDKNEKGIYWIEVDGADIQLETMLPDDIVFIRHRKNKQNKKEQEFEEEKKQEFVDRFIENIKITSRTAKGISEISVSALKEKSKLEGVELQDQVDLNTKDVAEYVWNIRNANINNVDDLKTILNVITKKVHYKTGASDLRSWDVKYGRKISPADLPKELEKFYSSFFLKITELKNNQISAHDLASWVEWSVDTDIHPFADGCGS